MEWLIAVGVIVTILVIVGGQYQKDEPRPADPPPPPEPREPPLPHPMFLVMQGPEKGLLLRLDPFASWGHPGAEGSWVCVDTDRRIFLRAEGLDSQIGMVLLDLWAMLGEEEAEATLARPMWVLPEPMLYEVSDEVGGFKAMEGWMQVPSLASYEPPLAEDFPELVHLNLKLPNTGIQMFMERARLLEVAGRRTHPTPARRDASKPTQRLRADSPERVLEVLKMAMDRYQTNPQLAVDLLKEAFSEGLPEDPKLRSAVCQTWALSLRNTGRIPEALVMFDEALELASEGLARQEIHYNRGYARLMTLMSERTELGGDQVRSAFEVKASDQPTIELCLADFRAAAELDPSDEQAASQAGICEQLLAAVKPPAG